MKVTIDSSISGITIREYLRGRLGYSTSMIRKLKFTDGGITVNGKFATVRHVLSEGEILELLVEDREEDTSPYIIPVDIPIEVLFEDECITAVNKPPFMPAHPSFGHREDTVANALAHRYRGQPYVFRPVNRLDRDTSGVMLTSNGKAASYKMYRHMVDGHIQKSYIAILDGVPENPEGEICSYMHRKEGSIVEREECSADDDGAKIAVTVYRVIAVSDDGLHSAVFASPITGRTHQLRVQFAGIGCPITGDTMYGMESPLINRQALHAVRSEFPHPESGVALTIEAPLPEDMVSLAKDFFEECDLISKL